MLFRQLLTVTAATVVTLTSSPFAAAQYYDSGCSSCNAAPAVSMASCAPIQPVYSSCYQTVPVTTYKKERMTVRKPYYKTAYEEREVTYYEPVTRKRTVEVPTVAYRTVQENRTVNRDLGRWQTNYHPTKKCAPCQVDPRPGMIGWLNRTGYSFRSAFVPNYRTTRQYVPKMVTCNVPVTRQVAVRGTKKVVINETKMVARRKTEKVEVRKLAYRDEEVTVRRPVTAYRSVPIGSSLAYGYGGYNYGRSSVAFIEDEDDLDSSRTVRRPERDPGFDDEPLQKADRTFRSDDPRRSTDRSGDKDENKFKRSSLRHEFAPEPRSKLKQPPSVFPDDEEPAPRFDPSTRSQRNYRKHYEPMADSRKTAPVVVGSWKSSRRSNRTQHTATAGDVTIPGLSMAR